MLAHSVGPSNLRSWPQQGQHPSRPWTNRKLVCTRGQSDRTVKVAAASSSAATKTEPEIEQAVALLQEASANHAVPSAQVFRALWRLEKEKLPDKKWNDLLGDGKGGRRWRAVFSAGPKDVAGGSKTGKGSGYYFPVTAVQRWETGKSEIENGVYLGQLAALSLTGPYEYKNKKLTFDFTKVKIRLGPKWFPFDVKGFKKGNNSPFFLIFYVDENIVCARGRGGGYGLWARTTADWELKSGVSL